MAQLGYLLMKMMK